jgi:hypothetical protein
VERFTIVNLNPGYLSKPLWRMENQRAIWPAQGMTKLPIANSHVWFSLAEFASPELSSSQGN